MALPKAPVLIIIDPEGDLTVRLYKLSRTGEAFKGASGDMISGCILASMKVSRQILIDNSSQFKALLTGQFQEARQNIIDVNEGTKCSLELWFRVLHDKMTDEMYIIPVADVWEAIEVCGYRQFDIEKLNTWFSQWLSRKDLKEMRTLVIRQLLYPCKEFDHAEGFAFLTRRLAYEVAEHITEINPTHHRHQHLDENVIGAINGSKGSLKVTFSYCMAVSKTGIWPLEHHHKKSAQEILDCPGFQNFNCVNPEGACDRCLGRLSPSGAQLTREIIRREFRGLCLDCMDKSKPKTGDTDEDYWEHDLNRQWSSGCRISHGQATWYFSFMGRRADMAIHQAQKKVQSGVMHASFVSR